MTTATLLVSCGDRTGIVAALSDFVFRHNGNIVDADQHSERATGRFFMRLRFDRDGFALDGEGIGLALDVLARRFEMHWELFDDERRPRVAVWCGRSPHCLYDLLVRQQLGELAGDIVLVGGNHGSVREVATHFGLPFEHLPMPREAGGKERAEARHKQILADHRIDLMVLARYMQILSPGFLEGWEGRIINIHHSFLPAFAGARPYHQAKERGVKIIGATAHYVTADLDQGPIIEQDVIRVTHRDEIEDLVRKGRDIERQVLARAVALHLERRVLIEGNRTIVFA